ncbi:MAG: hypothetical protein MR902_08995 [Campylobacter sp.]|nr:hypothetical protein [Campylobacter sp.]
MTNLDQERIFIISRFLIYTDNKDFLEIINKANLFDSDSKAKLLQYAKEPKRDEIIRILND